MDSDEAKKLSTADYSSSSFWKGTLPAYRETLTYPEEEQSEANFRSVDSIENLSNPNGSQMAISVSLDHLNLH